LSRSSSAHHRRIRKNTRERLRLPGPGITDGTAGDAEQLGLTEHDLRWSASAFRGKAHSAIARAGCIFTGRKSTLKLIVFSPSVQGEKKERWERLCEQVSTEQDPVKMLKLITEINELHMAKETRLLKAHPPAERKDP
jgi:hypothetical protein